MPSYTNLLLSICALSAATQARAADPQTESFLNIFSSTCMKHLNNLDALRSKLTAVPALPTDKAANFLQGSPGSAWPVPDKHGIFVLALPSNKNMCAVFARRVPSSEAESGFAKLVGLAPSPLKARLATDERGTSPRNGATRRITYEWVASGVSSKMLFMLSTADGKDADIQGLATASLTQ